MVLMDGDLQHPPEVIPQLVDGWRQGCDIVYGQRLDRAADSPLRRLLSRTYYQMFRVLSGTKLPEDAGDFRLISRRAVDALNRMGERARFNKGLFAWIGYTSMGVPFEVPERSPGDSSRWHLRRLLHFALDGVASFSTIPLRVWSYLGLAISLLAFLYIAVFVLDTLIYGTDLRGFPTLVVSIMFFAGVQLISLGVIGEYLGRIYEEVKARPLYLVAEELGLEQPSPEAGGRPDAAGPRACRASGPGPSRRVPARMAEALDNAALVVLMLILCADDYAMTEGVSQAIEALAEARRISATSAMVTTPHWPTHARRLARLRDRVAIGLHLNLTLGHRWRRCRRSRRTGAFLRSGGSRGALRGQLAKEEVAAEVGRQLDRFEAELGFRPTLSTATSTPTPCRPCARR